MKRRELASVAFAVALTSAGCALPAAAPVVAQCSLREEAPRMGPALAGQPYGMAMTALPLNSVQFGSADAARALAVQSLYAERSSTDLVQITARLLSCSDAPISVRIRTSFIRASTAPAEAPSAWRVIHLEPRATAVYAESSTVRDAASYLIEIAK